MARRYRIDHGLLGCGLGLALAMVATWPALAQSGYARRWSRVPQIEVKAKSFLKLHAGRVTDTASK